MRGGRSWIAGVWVYVCVCYPRSGTNYRCLPLSFHLYLVISIVKRLLKEKSFVFWSAATLPFFFLRLRIHRRTVFVCPSVLRTSKTNTELVCRRTSTTKWAHDDDAFPKTSIWLPRNAEVIVSIITTNLSATPRTPPLQTRNSTHYTGSFALHYCWVKTLFHFHCFSPFLQTYRL